MIVKKTILRLLGSSDDKKKGHPYGGSATQLVDGGRGGAAPRRSQGSALKDLQSKGQELRHFAIIG